MKQSKPISTERTHLFMPSAVIVMKADICSSVAGMEKLQQAIKMAVDQAAYANEILMSRLIAGSDGEVWYEKMDHPRYRFVVLQGGTDWKTVVKEQERIPYDFEKGELIRYFLIPSQDKVELLLFAHHLAGDGKSMMILLEDIRKALNGEELRYKELQIIGKEELRKKGRMSWLLRRYVAWWNWQWKREKQIFGKEDYRCVFENYWKERQTEIEDIIFTKEETEKIEKQCREYGVSVNSYLTTAILKAYDGDWTEIGYAVDVRDKAKTGMGNFVSGQAFETMYIRDRSFKENTWQTDSICKKKLKNSKSRYFTLHFLDMLDKTWIDSVCMQIYTGYESGAAKKLAHLMGYGNNQRALSLSNLTRFYLGREEDLYRLENLLFIPPVVSYGIRLFGMVTLNDRLGLTLHYNNGEIDGKDLFRRVVEVIRENLEEKAI